MSTIHSKTSMEASPCLTPHPKKSPTVPSAPHVCYMYVCMYVCVCICMCERMYVCVSVCIYVCESVCMYVCMCERMYLIMNGSGIRN